MKTINISPELFEKASQRSKTMQRSVDGQVEYWADIGCIAEDNPHLSFIAIRDILIGFDDLKLEHIEAYKFGEGKKRSKHANKPNKIIRTAKENITA